ncbi:Phage-related minor tail protein [Myroides sp. A21]|uniref:phage tail tape measure protein n=1 Tax=Myroides sp. A21 TaxID=1583100 RepID=UPI00057CB69F|nr:phage tail tape measure protein [Myroides sp. A21]AJA67317.1 Phage-related minor tail protein [Myroides sp. A21]
MSGNSTKTSWILELVDKVSTPIRDVVNNIDAVERATTASSSSIDNQKGKVKELEKEYGVLKKEALLAQLELNKIARTRAKTTNEEEVKKLTEQFELAKKKIEEYEKKIISIRNEIAFTISEIHAPLEQVNQEVVRGTTNWGELAIGINQGIELIQKATSALDFAVKGKELETHVRRLTDLSNEQLLEYVANSNKIADVYKKDATDVANTVHIMTKSLGGSYQYNFDLIEEGIKKGADVNNELLSSMKSNAGAFQQMGLSARDAIAIMAKSAKDGLSPKDALDSIKKAGNSLMEMTSKQEKALAGIGVKTKDLVGKTSWEAVQIVSNAMKGLDTQSRATAMARIFGTAGKESGLAFVEGLADELPNLNDMPEVEEAASGMKGFFSDVKSWGADAFGTVAVYAQQLSPMFQMLAGGIPLIQALSKVTWLQSIATKAWTAAQWLLNVAMDANPLGATVAALVFLIGLVYAAVDSFDTWGSTILFLLGPIGWLIEAIVLIGRHWDSIVEAFESDGIVGALKRIGLVLLDVLMHPIQKVLGWVAELTGWEWAKDAANTVEEFRRKNDLITPEEKGEKKEEKKEPSVNDFLQSNAERLKYSPTEDAKNKNKKGKEGNGLNVGSGSNGVKSITMNLTVNNTFGVNRDTNIRDIADKVTGYVNDQLRDALINIG